MKKRQPASPAIIKAKAKAKADQAAAISRGEEPQALGSPLDTPSVLGRGKGRPTDYQVSYPEKAAKLCALGATTEDLADFFGVTIRTIARWTVEHEYFCHAIKDAKEIADDRVQRSLYQRAIGYTFDAVKIMTSGGKEMVVPYREHVPPDVTAQIFWLKNRRKADWRDRSEQEVTHKVSLSREFEGLLNEIKDRPRITDDVEDADVVETSAA